MSYSYIKSVFPNFENSSKVYDKALYNELNSLDSDKIEIKPVLSINIEDKLSQFTRDLALSNKKDLGEFEIPQDKFLEHYKNTQDYSDVDFKSTNNANDNLKFYNLPSPKEYYIDSKRSTNEKTIEKFTDNTNCDLNCDSYIKHIMECSKCKSITMKQFGVESDRIRNEEIMEVISYLIFGLFILLLLDSLKK